MGSEGKKRGLGRGLAALLGSEGSEAARDLPAGAQARAQQAGQQAAQQVALDRLSPNPHQPRKEFDAESLRELADSIRVHGIIQPLVVTAAQERPGHFWIIAGERRWRAARLAELEAVPVILREASAQALTELALVENIQRADLSPLEEAQAYQALLEEHGLTQAEVAERVGKSRPAVANTLRLLGLPQAVQAALREGRISAGHARALLALPDEQAILTVLGLIEGQQLSVRGAEALVKAWLQAPRERAGPPEPVKAPIDAQWAAQISQLENRFRAALGTKVNLNRNDDGSGRLVVHFYNDDDLETLYRLIAGGEDAGE
jgi:ParB family chromosome partitioning protein